MSIDERLSALAVNRMRANRDIQDLIEAGRRDRENIRVLVRVAEIRRQRLTHLEGGA